MSYYSDEMYEPEIEQGGPLYQMYSDYVDKAIVEDIELQSAFKNTPPDELDQSFLRDAAGRLDRSGSRLATAASIQGKEYLVVMGEHVEVDKNSTSLNQAERYRTAVQQTIFGVCEELGIDEFDIVTIAQEAFKKAVSKAEKMAPIHEIKRKAGEIATKMRAKVRDIQQRINPEQGPSVDMALFTDNQEEEHHMSR